MKKMFFFVLLPIIFGCRFKNNEHLIPGNFQEVNTGPFSIAIPKTWKYAPEQGEDSFVGTINGPDVSFYFDFSNHGYANHLIASEQEYLKGKDWIRECHFCKFGATTVGFPDEDAKRNFHLPTAAQRAKYPKADYIGDLTFKDSIVYIPIIIPEEIKSHHLEEKTEGGYKNKTIWPKIPSKGMTGIYIQSVSSPLNFQLSGSNLSKQNQELALQAFKTIVIHTK